MPAYDYICTTCGVTFERNAHFSDTSGENTITLTCPNGHTQVRRIYTAPAVVFKGSGFYSTDHRPKQSDS